MIRIRTIQQAAAEIKEKDPNTAITEFYIRKVVASGLLPNVRKSGSKYLLCMSDLELYLAGELKGGGESNDLQKNV